MKTKITLHGKLGEAIGKEWNLAVKSVGEAMTAIQVLSGKSLYKFLFENDRCGLRYAVFINDKQFIPPENLKTDIEEVKNSELLTQFSNLQTVDIVPVLEGSSVFGLSGPVGTALNFLSPDTSILYGFEQLPRDDQAIVLGALLIVAGIALTVFTYGIGAYVGGALIVGGIGLIAAGVLNLLSPPPKDLDEIKTTSATSYLFTGPQNTSREGGAIPVGYGRLIVGSQVIAAAYDIKYVDATTNPTSV